MKMLTQIVMETNVLLVQNKMGKSFKKNNSSKSSTKSKKNYWKSVRSQIKSAINTNDEEELELLDIKLSEIKIKNDNEK